MDGKLYQETPLGEWFRSKNGVVNPSLVFRKETTGHGLEATEDIQKSTQLISMPYELAITPKLVLSELPTELTQDLGDHQLMCLYLMMHDCVLSGLPLPYELKHLEYVKTLPRPHQMQTALYFNDAEFDLLRGSNLYPAVLDRRKEWELKHKDMLRKLEGKLPFDASNLSWERFLWASTALSSRAFPSYLLDGDKENATQVLLPCIDVFNHKRGAAVTWFSDHQNKKMQLITDEAIPAGQEVFNNYGAKPNDELLLGYGFLLEDNPSDLISLRFGAQGEDDRIKLLERLKIPIAKSHYIRRDLDDLPEELKAQIRVLVSDEEELSEIQTTLNAEENEPWKAAVAFLSWPNELEMLGQLADMLSAKLASVQGALDRTQAAARRSNGKKRQRSTSPELNTISQETEQGGMKPQGIREDIRSMIEIYLTGQAVLLEQCLAVQERDFDLTVQKARDDGFDVEEEEDEDDSDHDEASNNALESKNAGKQ